MKFVEILNLPDPVDEIKQRSFQLIDRWQHNQRFTDNLKKFVLKDRNTNVASAAQVFDDRLTKLIQEQYQSFFSFPVESALSFFRNIGTTPACLPPHTHPSRTVAMQYYFEVGGNVQTVLYDFVPNYNPSRFLDYFDYSDVKYNSHIVFEKEKWVMFNTRTPHSVENIERLRAFISFTFDPAYTVQSVLQDSKLEYKIVVE